MAKKRPAFSPGFYNWTKEDYHKISWCINNGIACCVVPARKADVGGYDFCIEIKVKDKVSYSPPYTKDQASLKQKEFYHYYKNKYDKNI